MTLELFNQKNSPKKVEMPLPEVYDTLDQYVELNTAALLQEVYASIIVEKRNTLPEASATLRSSWDGKISWCEDKDVSSSKWCEKHKFLFMNLSLQ